MTASFGNSFQLSLFTADIELARRADEAGIDRIGPDLEQRGKVERQGESGGWISTHRLSDLERVGSVLKKARLLTRINPMHRESGEEIEAVLARGAEVVWLPMATTPEEVQRFLELLAGRAHPVVQVETPQAAARIHQLASLPGLGELHVGLNDLHLGWGLCHHFEVLASPLMACLARSILEAGKTLSFGGLGRVGDGNLPIPADLVHAQYPRLGGTAALVSRSFFPTEPLDLVAEIAALRQNLTFFHEQRDKWEEYGMALREHVEQLRIQSDMQIK